MFRNLFCRRKEIATTLHTEIFEHRVRVRAARIATQVVHLHRHRRPVRILKDKRRILLRAELEELERADVRGELERIDATVRKRNLPDVEHRIRPRQDKAVLVIGRRALCRKGESNDLDVVVGTAQDFSAEHVRSHLGKIHRQPIVAVSLQNAETPHAVNRIGIEAKGSAVRRVDGHAIRRAGREAVLREVQFGIRTDDEIRLPRQAIEPAGTGNLASLDVDGGEIVVLVTHDGNGRQRPRTGLDEPHAAIDGRIEPIREEQRRPLVDMHERIAVRIRRKENRPLPVVPERHITAHHLDDNIETLFLNLSRGTGINGLTGISAQNGKIVRPLLFATRGQIEEYARLNKLEFRTDITNLADDYQRNIVRHQVVPVMKQINPAFEDRMLKNFKHIRQASDIYNWYIGKTKNEILTCNDNETRIDVDALLRQEFVESVLFECVKPYGFNSSQVESMMKIVGQKSGSTFSSSTHNLLIDRKSIIIRSVQSDDFQPLQIDKPHDVDSIGLKMKVVPISEFNLDKSPNVACLDIDKLQFPLTIRRWQQGDYFYPIGMNRAKKLSDFFIDIKVDVFAKKSALVLTSGERIAWIVGYRPDNRFKVDANTQNVLVICKQG